MQKSLPYDSMLSQDFIPNFASMSGIASMRGGAVKNASRGRRYDNFYSTRHFYREILSTVINSSYPGGQGKYFTEYFLVSTYNSQLCITINLRSSFNNNSDSLQLY